MSDRDNMPCGYADTGNKLTFSKVKKLIESVRAEYPELRGVTIIEYAKIIPIDKLLESQKQNLAIDCWKYGLWKDIFIGDDQITKNKAIDAVKESSALGKELVHLVITGYAHIYKSFLPHDEQQYPLSATSSSQSRWSSASPISPASSPAIELPGPLKKKLETKPEQPLTVPEASTSPSESQESSVMIHNSLSFTVYIYSYSGKSLSKCISDIPVGVKTKFSVLKYNEQLVATKGQMDFTSIVSAYITNYGCTTWNIASFPVDSFLPSTWQLDPKPWKVLIVNHLRTHVCIWQVLPNGSLHFIDVLQHRYGPHCYNYAEHCYIGTSLVATQGDTVISKFFVDSKACVEWLINPAFGPYTPEPVTDTTGDNNYIFYQVNTLRDDWVPPMPNNFSKQIVIPSGVKFLYASLFDPCNAYFAVPKDVTVTIDSQDASGAITRYNSDTNTESLYIQMAASGKSVQKLCVKAPTAGKWTINIKAKTNTQVFFQFQTVPTKSPYDTTKNTLSKLLGLKWKCIAYAGFTNICNTQKFGGDNDIVVMPVAVAPVGMALFNGKVAESQWAQVFSDLQNCDGDIEKGTSTVCNKVAPPPPNLPNILLVDANGDDKATKRIYESREQFLYKKVEIGVPQNNYSKLVGENEATRELFLTRVADSNLKLVSVAGHGNNNKVCGYGQHVILDTTNVNRDLVKGKIFHFYACCTAIGLGPELNRNEAIAYVGYDKTLQTLVNKEDYDEWVIKPDCTIVLELIQGKTVREAVNRARAYYKKLLNRHKDQYMNPFLIGILKDHYGALRVQGNLDARI